MMLCSGSTPAVPPRFMNLVSVPRAIYRAREARQRPSKVVRDLKICRLRRSKAGVKAVFHDKCAERALEETKAGIMVRWWSKDTVAVVTGGNKGIGFEIVRGLAKSGVTTVLTARDVGRGQKAADSLKADGLDSVLFHQLDLNNPDSIDALAVWVKDKFGGLDILVNNAGVFEQSKSYEAAKATLDTNYYAVKNLTNKLLPLLRPGARIISISSILGQLSYVGESKAKILGDEPNLTEEFVDTYAVKYLEAVKAGRWKEEGWSTAYPQYSDSKVLLNAYTRAFAKTLSKRPDDQKVYVNVVHPGYIGTDLNNNSGPGTTEEGADTAVWLALLPEKNYPHGEFWYKRKHLAY